MLVFVLYIIMYVLNTHQQVAHAHSICRGCTINNWRTMYSYLISSLFKPSRKRVYCRDTWRTLHCTFCVCLCIQIQPLFVSMCVGVCVFV